MGLLIVLLGLMGICIALPIIVLVLKFIGAICFGGLAIAFVELLPIIIAITIIVYLVKRGKWKEDEEWRL